MDDGERELEMEDEIFEQIISEEDDEASASAALLDEDDAEVEFVQGSVDAQDLAVGFSATIPTREIDVDEDTQGDEAVDAGAQAPLTAYEVAGGPIGAVHGDEIELDLQDTLTTGSTVAKAPEGD
jgi:hypothetical protein